MYIVYQHGKHNGNSHLSDQCYHDHDHCIFQRHADIFICKDLQIVFIYRIIQSPGGTAQIPDLHKTVDNILKERIIKKYCHKQKCRNQKKKDWFFVFVDHQKALPGGFFMRGCIRFPTENLPVAASLYFISFTYSAFSATISSTS